MCDKTDYRPMLGFEKLYKINRLGTIKCFDVEINCRNRKVHLRVFHVIYKTIGKTLHAVVRDENCKQRKINVTVMIKNVFGRQKPLIDKRGRYPDLILKKENTRGRKGIPVEQFVNGKSVGVFPTIASAALAVGGTPAKVSDAAYGKVMYYAGSKWKIKKNK